MTRPIVYPESRVGSTRTVAGHRRRSACLDEHASIPEEAKYGSLPSGEKLNMDVGALLDRYEADPASLNEEELQFLVRAHNVDS